MEKKPLSVNQSDVDAVSQAIVALFNSERFYAELIANMDRHFTNQISTVGVCIKNKIELHINPVFFSGKTMAERVAVLKHECEHILCDHIPRMKQMAPEVYGKQKDQIDSLVSQMKHKTMNIAADMAINGAIPNLPKGGVFAKNFDLPDGETVEWYLSKLKDNDKAKSFMEFDDHALWGESEGSEEILKEKLRKAVVEAATKAKAAGKLSAEHELLVSKLTANTVDWKVQLRRFISKSRESKTRLSRKKRNRRYGINQPGKIRTEVLRLGVAMDTSGSVSDRAIEQFMSEIHNIVKYAKITVVEADREIKNIYEYDPKKKYSVKGRGGTAYQPVFEHFNKEGEIDGLIYFGDMDCADNDALQKPKYPVLWAIVGTQEPPATFGSKIQVKV